MEQYHIGQEIKKEMLSKGMTASQLAEKINLTPQAVYDIFKKNHIATDRLMDVQRVLGRDFFKELSQVAINGGALADEEDENAVKERFEMLMPEDKLHVLDMKALSVLAEEFVMTEHYKPLVIFYTKEWRAQSVIGNVADVMLGAGKVYDLDLDRQRKKIGKSNDEIIQLVKAMPQPIVNVIGTSDDEGLLFMVNLAQATGKKVYACCRSSQSISNQNLNAEYSDTAIQRFASWYEQIHFALVDDELQSYRGTRQMFLADRGLDILSFIHWQLLEGILDVENYVLVEKWLNNPNLLYSAYREYLDALVAKNSQLKAFCFMLIDDELDIKQEGSRWILRLPVHPSIISSIESNLTRGGNRRLSMWIDVEDNSIVDFEGGFLK